MAGIPDPWTLSQSFIDNLNDMAAKNRYYNQQGQTNLYDAMVQQQRDQQLNSWKQAADENNFNQQLLRDEAQREFTHNENYLRSTYDAAGGGSKSRFAQPAAGGGGMPVYQSPLQTTQSTGPAQGGGANAAYSYYKSKGVHPMVAAGLVGNFDAESSFDPNAIGDAGASYGYGQWNDKRRTNLMRFAQSRGHAQPTHEDMLDFPFHEAETGSDPGAKRALELAEQAATPEEAAKWIRMYYERPAEGPTMQEERRQRVARQVYDTGGQGGGTQAQPSTDQRRHTGPVVQPDTGDMPAEAPMPVETSGPTDIFDPEHVWTEEDLAKYLRPDEIAAIRNKGMDVIGPPRIYTDTAMSLLPDEIQRQLMPVAKNEQYGPQEWLYMQPRQGGEVTEDGVDPGGEPQPQITAAPPVEIKPTGTNPNDPKGSESTKIINGVWHTLVDGRWVRMD